MPKYRAAVGQQGQRPGKIPGEATHIGCRAEQDRPFRLRGVVRQAAAFSDCQVQLGLCFGQAILPKHCNAEHATGERPPRYELGLRGAPLGKGLTCERLSFSVTAGERELRSQYLSLACDALRRRGRLRLSEFKAAALNVDRLGVATQLGEGV